MLKKKNKSKEEKTAEEYFPVDIDDLKKTTEKPVKEPYKEEILRGAIEIPVKENLPKEELLRGSIEKPYKKPDRNEIEIVEPIEIKKKKFKKNNYAKKF